MESSVLVSGGADMTVRVWYVIQKPSDKGADGGALRKRIEALGLEVAVRRRRGREAGR
jgi:hypothetical protein